jgi:MFS transporter, DHA2 family, multidrug resistance protein
VTGAANTAHPDHPHVNPWIVTVSVMLATFMELLDTTVVNVSIPHIAGNLAASVDEGTWVVASISSRTPSSFLCLDGSPADLVASVCC